MAELLDAEAVESEDEEELFKHKRKHARLPRTYDSDENESDDEREMQKELESLIDDNPVEEGSGSESDTPRKRRDREDDLDDRFEDEDYDLIEENLGFKIARKKRFKRLRQMDDDEDEDINGNQQTRETLVNNTVAIQSDEELTRSGKDEGLGDSDSDDFIVDDEGRPLTARKKKPRPIYNNTALQEAQDIFGVDFNYDDLQADDNDDDDEREEDDDYLEEVDEDGGRSHRRGSRKNTNRKSIFEIYEPSELQRRHYTDLDEKIRINDVPERIQLRDVPVTKVPEDSDELAEEAEWIYKFLYCRPTVSSQDVQGGVDPRTLTKKGVSTVGKIKNALRLIRNENMDIPFIAFYRKEYTVPELSVNDLWNIFKYDGKWCQLKSRKEAHFKLLENVCQYQLERYGQDHSKIPDDYRPVTDKDFELLKEVETTEELNDVHQHFMLHYDHLLSEVIQKMKKKEFEEKRLAWQQSRQRQSNCDDSGSLIEKDNDGNFGEDNLPDFDVEGNEMMKRAVRSGPYAICKKYNLAPFLKRFGLDTGKFAENVRDDYQTHDVQEQSVPVFPLDLARGFCNRYLTAPEDVLNVAKFMMATQIAREPLVKKVFRELYFKRAKIYVKPTPKGIIDIDENHMCYAVKYLKEKPVSEIGGFEFLKLRIAEDDGLLKITFDDDVQGHKSPSYLADLKTLFKEVGFQGEIKAWNEIREECVELAYRKMLIPTLVKELKEQLHLEAKQCLLKLISSKLYNWLSVAPYFLDLDEDDEWDTSRGLRIMGVAYENDFSASPYACVILPGGECAGFMKFPNLLKRKNSYRDEERQAKEKDLAELKAFIMRKKPHVICVGAESLNTLMVVEDIREVVSQLVEDEQIPTIPVEILDNNLARVYANSIKGSRDFPDYPLLLRQAISLARRMQDPLVEFSQLCNSDNEILCLQFHPLQNHLPQEELLETIYREFINRTNEVGVDLNAVIQNPYFDNLLKFVSGFGDRKATALLKVSRQTNRKLKSRGQMMNFWNIGARVWMNCAGFIKIHAGSWNDGSEDESEFLELLDGSRIHPEAYDWAYKMAIDALDEDNDNDDDDYDDVDTEIKRAAAVEKILKSPKKLEELDLEAFANELNKQNYGLKEITLFDIKKEFLGGLYKDERAPFKPLEQEDLFDLLTKENAETFYCGKLVVATVVGFARRKVRPEEFDKANPIRNESDGLWQCPFCRKNDFAELSDVWNHFDGSSCPGHTIGIRIRLDNGVYGFVHAKNLSKTPGINPEERVRIGQAVRCRITNIDVGKLSIEATCKSNDLYDEGDRWKIQKDPYYDYGADVEDERREQKRKEMKASQVFIKRPILHPNFKNVSYNESMALLKKMDQGDCIIRPSSKGIDHLTLTWKVTENIYQFIDIHEKKDPKQFKFALGKTLVIGKEEFQDLEEIIARFIEPMAANAREIMNNKYYKNEATEKDKANAILLEEKNKDPGKIHYIFSASAEYPGRFMLSYLPRDVSKHEYIAVLFDGFRFRNQTFESLGSLVRWFKVHFRDPIPEPAKRNSNSSLPVPTPIADRNPAMPPYAYTVNPFLPSPGCFTPSFQTIFQQSESSNNPPDWEVIPAGLQAEKSN